MTDMPCAMQCFAAQAYSQQKLNCMTCAHSYAYAHAGWVSPILELQCSTYGL